MIICCKRPGVIVYLTAVLVFIVSLTLNAQRNELVPMVKKLASTPGIVYTHQTEEFDKTILFEVPVPFAHRPVELLKTSTGLIAFVEGTGYIYQLDTTHSKNNWVRIDSTYFTGYNFRCFNFVLDTTLYSFGGTGLWNTNGQLRYFVPAKREWEIVLLNREVPHIFDHQDFYHLDSSTQSLYLLGKNFENPTVYNNEERIAAFANKIWKLDIEKREWSLLGTSKDTALTLLGISPWGMAYVHSTKPGIIDFKNNRYLVANRSGETKFANFFSARARKSITFFIDSTLYIGNLSGYLDSMSFTSADFDDTGVRVYDPSESSGTDSMLSWGLPVAALLLVAFIFVWRKQKPKLEQQAIEPEPIQADITRTDPEPLEILDDREKSLLQFIWQQSLGGKVVTIEDLNKQLGVANKSPEIQKRQRSDSLTALNQKLAFLSESGEPVIDKQRSITDKRTFEYFIRPEMVSKVGQLLKSDI